MTLHLKRAVVVLSCAAICLCGCAIDEERFETQGGANGAGASRVIAASEVSETVSGDWGNLDIYFTEDTHVLKPVLVGVARLEAGEQIHPPHRHADEEYLMVTRGRGSWHLNGDIFEANEGDILFARAWDYHGVRAAEDSPLEFVVFKYSGRHIDPPADPRPGLPEELQE